jgi:hypothetical protein
MLYFKIKNVKGIKKQFYRFFRHSFIGVSYLLKSFDKRCI